MATSDDLDRLEERLEAVVDALKDEEYQAAQAEAIGISDILDCPLCENIENGVLGGVMFATGLTPAQREQRTKMVRQEVERFLNYELPQARKRLEELDAVDPEAEV